MIECPHCSRLFEKTSHLQKYCKNSECIEDRRIQKNRDMKEYMKTYKHKKKVKPPKPDEEKSDDVRFGDVTELL